MHEVKICQGSQRSIQYQKASMKNLRISCKRKSFSTQYQTFMLSKTPNCLSPTLFVRSELHTAGSFALQLHNFRSAIFTLFELSTKALLKPGISLSTFGTKRISAVLRRAGWCTVQTLAPGRLVTAHPGHDAAQVMLDKHI
jgi:hypothetical protein